MPQLVTKTERGWCGHHICGDRMQFRRNTLLHRLDDDVRIVVSTVGAMQEPEGYSTVGADRVYETMAFHAQEATQEDSDTTYWDVDVSQQVHWESEWQIKPAIPGEIIGNIVTFDMDAQANDMHENIVMEILKRLEAGEPFEKEYDECLTEEELEDLEETLDG